MNGRMSPIRRRATVFGIAAIGVIALGGTAIAGHIESDVKSYTGCLSANDGVILKVKQGDAPKSACTSGQTQVHLSGGDITSITGGTGVQVTNGTNGGATVALDPQYGLRQDCASGQVVKWNGSAWACGADSNSTYAASTGLDLSGTTFSIEPAYQVKNTSDCDSGKFATGFDSVGNLQCAAPPTPAGVRAYYASVGNVVIGGPTTVISKALPAGVYLLSATVEIKNKDSDSPSAMDFCSIPGYTTTESISVDVGRSEIVSLMSAVNHPGGTVVLTCDEFVADVDVATATLSAIEVGSLG